jgi:hypothetical protein
LIRIAIVYTLIEILSKSSPSIAKVIMQTKTNFLLDRGFAQAIAQLRHFAEQDDFLAQLHIAFGDRFDPQIAERIASQLQAGDLSLLPKIQVLTEGELGTANGAYSEASDTILVSADFLDREEDDINAVAELLLEEIGHKLDYILNGCVDSHGDEGAIFLLLATGYPLSEDTLAGLRAADDHAIIQVAGQLVGVEQQDFDELETLADDGLDASMGEFIDWFFL